MNFSILKNLFHQYFSFFFYFLISFMVLFYFKGHYILTLDLIFPMKHFFTNCFYGFIDPVWGEHVFVSSIMKLLDIPQAWAIQKLFLFLIIFLSGISMHSLISTKSQIPKYYAGILYTINPFVYVRFLAGHWLILLSYSIVPFAVKYFLDFLNNQNNKNLIKSLLITTLTGAFSTQLLSILFLVYLFLAMLKVYKIKDESILLKKFLFSLCMLAVLFIMMNFYWLLPLFTAKATLLHQISQADIHAFATRTSSFNVVFTIASMYGFWRYGYIHPKDFIPYWHLLFFFILFLAIHGFINNYKNKSIDLPVKTFAIVAVIAVIFGSGINGPFSSLFDFLFNNIFFFKGLRDSHKFTALLVLSYSYLGALGVADFVEIARGHVTAQDRYTKYKKLAAWVIIIAALVTPMIYSFTMFNGFCGQLKPTDYPEDWYKTNGFLINDSQDFNVLFLPWHAYMDFKWIPNSQKRILNPASYYFDKTIISGENIEIGSIYSQSTNPAQTYVESLLNDRNNITNFGEKMVLLNVKYILLTKEVDYKEYFFLFNQTDIELIKETENFYIFLNKHQVSRFYYSPNLPTSSPKQHEYTSSLEPIGFKQFSPVKFFTNKTNGYIVFVPSNLNSDYWKLNGNPSMVNDFIAIYQAKKGQIYYKRFDTYLMGYIVSLITLIGIIIWYKKESMEKILRKIRDITGSN